MHLQKLTSVYFNIVSVFCEALVLSVQLVPTFHLPCVAVHVESHE